MAKNVHVNLKPLWRLWGSMNLPFGGNKRALYMRWRARYLGYIRREFVRKSRGSGWAPHSAATKRKRGSKAAILRETGTLLKTLDISNARNFKMVLNGIRVGFLSRNKAKKREGTHAIPAQITVDKLAEIHQFGTHSIPARPIIENPNKQTQHGMMRDLKRYVRGEFRRFGGRS